MSLRHDLCHSVARLVPNSRGTTCATVWHDTEYLSCVPQAWGIGMPLRDRLGGLR